jgi:hypothetical protein
LIICISQRRDDPAQGLGSVSFLPGIWFGCNFT